MSITHPTHLHTHLSGLYTHTQSHTHTYIHTHTLKPVPYPYYLSFFSLKKVVLIQYSLKYSLFQGAKVLMREELSPKVLISQY